MGNKGDKILSFWVHMTAPGKEQKLVSDQDNLGVTGVGKEVRDRLHTGSERQRRVGWLGFSLGPGLLKWLFKSYPEYLLARLVLSTDRVTDCPCFSGPEKSLWEPQESPGQP